MWELAKRVCQSRLLVGTALYPSLDILRSAIKASKAQVITVSLKHENTHVEQSQPFLSALQSLDCWVLPNTAGCMSADEAIEIAEMSREIFQTNWIKVEVVCPQLLLQPNPFELVKVVPELIRRGFEVFPFCTDDLALCQHLYDSGCEILMPWAAPIGSGKGILNAFQLKSLRRNLPNATLIVDAGIGSPQHALMAMQLGCDGVLVNSAIAKALDPIMMAKAFALAVESGRLSFKAGVMPECDTAISSTLLADTLYGAQHDSYC